MSLSKPPWNHFGPHHPFPDKQRFHSFYRDAPSFLPPLGFSISAALVPPVTSNMSNSANMNALSQDEMERFQKLSNEFEPDVQVCDSPPSPSLASQARKADPAKGPLVSTKQSSHNIAMEYANADPAFARKTNALAVTHPTVRIMKGDGNCGWRAVAFGYFETLFSRLDPIRVRHEMARFKSLNTMLSQVGLQEHLYEIFTDATDEILTQTHQAIQNGEPDEEFLVSAFNDEYSANAVITHFRLLTSAWMKLNPQRYQAYLTLPLDQYCATRIEPVRTEIDEIGLQALVDGVLEGAEFGVEILYLDRSEGENVTPHQLTPIRPPGATIRLLYRPGHYDLLYRAESTYQSPPPVNMTPMVNLQYDMTSNLAAWDQGALNFDVNSQLMSIPNLMADPGFGMGAPGPMSPMPSVSPTPTSPFRLSPSQEMYSSPMQSHVSSHAPSHAQSHAPVPSIPVSSPTPTIPSAAPPPMTSLPSRSSDGPQIRLNPLVMKPNLSYSLPVTTPFKNSPYNQAHFQNSDFQPIHYEPNDSRRS
ncbi:hypothetical protein N7532_001674 [Penicillium argentinense]|uniref:ubiquitinyl hydrolase 1 n=1 Tax=Penicillium argentinense TaxID=1131581 RepID=A0A9W9G2Z0_9EURO|nr:uncharacterized protein N7532_001674 [Penicillium argentinense]KAJ5111139.1 hypothetical protein N7532_001674 [Penicillium argentinense]